MIDIEITKLCAEAINFYANTGDFLTPDGEVLASVAEYPVKVVSTSALGRDDPMSAGGVIDIYNPLHDDAQAMVLQNWLIENGVELSQNRVWLRFWFDPMEDPWMFKSESKEQRRHAICECVAKMWQRRSTYHSEVI